MTDKTTLYLLCGLPASGKTSLCKLRQGRVITADIIRKGIVGNLGDSAHDQFVWDIACRAAGYFLQFSDVYYDATNSTRLRRQPFIEKAKTLEKDVVCVWVNTSLDVCIKQNQKRASSSLETPLPNWVIENVASVFEPPSIDEGFLKIEKWLPSSSGFSGEFVYTT
ncbi:MAG: ATP-binding protein [Firmicutes bacterium]|nr:ATP-binding protein [Bacillota bacterium]MDD4264163.1 ATP-binding protein [Bacillota bacterium]MDD4694221.1 ATP-binding protein [Bacillota bacterium]